MNTNLFDPLRAWDGDDYLDQASLARCNQPTYYWDKKLVEFPLVT